MTKQAKILELLADGPGLTCELAAELCYPDVGAYLSWLYSEKKIDRTRFDIGQNGCVRYLWKLPT